MDIEWTYNIKISKVGTCSHPRPTGNWQSVGRQDETSAGHAATSSTEPDSGKNNRLGFPGPGVLGKAATSQ